MTPLSLLVALLSVATPTPQDSQYLTQKLQHLRVQFVPTEITEVEAKQIGQTFEEMWSIFDQGLGIEPPSDVTLILRLRSNTKMFYYTNGQRKAYIDFPTAGLFRPSRPKNKRIEDIARRIWAQLWLFQCLDTTGGLDPRVLQSVIEYHRLAQLVMSDQRPESIKGPGALWSHLEQLYGPGTASFLLDILGSEKLRADQLGEFLRTSAALSLEDDAVKDVFDIVTPALAVFAPEDREPGEALADGTTLRRSRLALFNGIQLIDDASEPLSVGDRVRDFQAAFSLIVQCYPSRSVAAFPPMLNGHNLHEIYFEFRPRVECARDNIDYYLVMREFTSRFSDRWLNILSPQATAMWKGVVGLSLTSIGDHVHVSSVTEESDAQAAGVRPGMEIVEIDGRPVNDVWDSLSYFFSITTSCSSQRESRARALNVLLTGADVANVKLLTSDEELNIELPRGLPPTSNPGAEAGKPTDFVEIELREDNVGVIAVKVFTAGAVAQFKAALDDFVEKKVTGVVVDLRGVSQGNPGPAFATLGMLISKPIALGHLALRNASEPPGTVLSQPVIVKAIGVNPYTGKVAVLIDTWTAGAAELFALGFRSAARGQLVGSRSTGAMNQPMQPIKSWQTLSSSGLVLSLTQNIILGPGNESILGNGVEPHLQCEAVAQELEEGIDSVLERAVTHLTQ